MATERTEDNPHPGVRARWRRAGARAFIGAAALLIAPTAVAEGLYLRAGVGLHRPAETQFTDQDCSSVSPAALYGCGKGGDGAPLRSTGDFGNGADIALGLGYAVSPAVRIEALVEYSRKLTFEGRANFLDPSRLQSVSADLSSWSGMLTAYVDLPELGLPRFGPFIGAGIGAARVAIDETRMTFPRTTTIVPGASRTRLAWTLTAGLEVSLRDPLKLDLAWRYTDYGAVQTGKGSGQVVWRDGSREPLALDLAPTRAKHRSHGLGLSLRYAF